MVAAYKAAPPGDSPTPNAERSTPYVPPLHPLPSAIKRFLRKAARDELYATLLEVLTRLAKMERRKKE